jgi:5-methylcytosine-specific restriction protein A
MLNDGLNDITSRQAILDAVDEYERLGRTAFLKRYGFGRARDFSLVVDGRHYDSKAIAGAAHGYQFPNEGPLTPYDFGGGKHTVKPLLESLRFEVLVRRAPDAC